MKIAVGIKAVHFLRRLAVLFLTGMTWLGIVGLILLVVLLV